MAKILGISGPPVSTYRKTGIPARHHLFLDNLARDNGLELPAGFWTSHDPEAVVDWDRCRKLREWGRVRQVYNGLLTELEGAPHA